jgi:hypothetical protein
LQCLDGLGVAGARQVEAFFAAHPALTERARALVTSAAPPDLLPWECLFVPELLDGSQVTFRAHSGPAVHWRPTTTSRRVPQGSREADPAGNR